MKKIILSISSLVLVFGACNKSDVDNVLPIEEATMQSKAAAIQTKMIPIAKLTEKNEIEPLFLQKDVQAFFSKENPEGKLVFVEVVDDKKFGNEPGLLYRIYYANNKTVETSIYFVLTSKERVYYISASSLGGRKITCTTSDCSDEPQGCVPDSDTSCTKCSKILHKCTKTVESEVLADANMALTRTVSNLRDALRYAVSVY